MAIVFTRKTKSILLGVLGVLVLGGGGFLVWRVNQPDTVAPEDSEAGADCTLGGEEYDCCPCSSSYKYAKAYYNLPPNITDCSTAVNEDNYAATVEHNGEIRYECAPSCATGSGTQWDGYNQCVEDNDLGEVSGYDCERCSNMYKYAYARWNLPENYGSASCDLAAELGATNVDYSCNTSCCRETYTDSNGVERCTEDWGGYASCVDTPEETETCEDCCGEYSNWRCNLLGCEGQMTQQRDCSDCPTELNCQTWRCSPSEECENEYGDGYPTYDYTPPIGGGETDEEDDDGPVWDNPFDDDDDGFGMDWTNPWGDMDWSDCTDGSLFCGLWDHDTDYSSFFDEWDDEWDSTTTTTRYTLIYRSGIHGYIWGIPFQVVKEGEDGSSVKAIPYWGWEFSKWSDGSTSNPRVDRDVDSDLTVSAEFVRKSTTSYVPGEEYVDNKGDVVVVTNTGTEVVYTGSTGTVPQTGIFDTTVGKLSLGIFFIFLGGTVSQYSKLNYFYNSMIEKSEFRKEIRKQKRAKRVRDRLESKFK